MNRYELLFRDVDTIFGRPTCRNVMFKACESSLNASHDETGRIAKCYAEIMPDVLLKNIDYSFCRRNVHCLDLCLHHYSLLDNISIKYIISAAIKCFVILSRNDRFNSVGSLYSYLLRCKYGVGGGDYIAIEPKHINILSRCLYTRFTEDVEEQNIDTQLLSMILLFNDNLEFILPLFNHDMNPIIKKYLSEFILQLNEFYENGDSVVAGLAVISGTMLVRSKLLDNCGDIYEDLGININDHSPSDSDTGLLDLIEKNRGLFLRDTLLSESALNYALSYGID